MRGDDLTYCVYIHTCPNGKVYIGITSQNPLRRWREGKGYIHNEYFYNAILKYGWDNIKHEILFAGLTEDEACEKEVELIAQYKSNNRKYGYNFCEGGQINRFPEEYRLKLSVQYSGKGNPRARRVKNLDTNEEFDTVISAAKSVNGTKTGIARACKGMNATHKGCRWRYVNE